MELGRRVGGTCLKFLAQHPQVMRQFAMAQVVGDLKEDIQAHVNVQAEKMSVLRKARRDTFGVKRRRHASVHLHYRRVFTVDDAAKSIVYRLHKRFQVVRVIAAKDASLGRLHFLSSGIVVEFALVFGSVSQHLLSNAVIVMKVSVEKIFLTACYVGFALLYELVDKV